MKTLSLLKKTSLTNSKNLYQTGKYFGGSNVESAVPKGSHFKSAPKVKDLIIWVNVIGADGSLKRFPGWPNEPLNHVITRHQMEGFRADCDGGDPDRKYSEDTPAAAKASGPLCGKCHVVVSEPWFSYMKPKIHPVEQSVLEQTHEIIFPNSRLACCFALKPWMNELIVRAVHSSNINNLEDKMDNVIGDSSIGGANNYKIYPY